LEELPYLIRVCVENAMKNSSCHPGNRYECCVKTVAMWFFLRTGKTFYDFLSQNMMLPTYKTIQRSLASYKKKLHEGEMDFDGVVAGLK
jgi:hypothetical protein